MSNVWFTSDLHFGHQKVAEIRDFKTTEEHDEAVFESLINRLHYGDTLYVLGDVSSGSTASREAAFRWLRRAKYDWRDWTLRLIAGNHDDSHPMHSGSHKALGTDSLTRLFDSVQQSATRKINGHRVLLSHFPYLNSGRPDHSDVPRYAQWRLPDLGQPLLHGHTHLADQNIHRSNSRTLQIHVGWDAWRRPISINEVAEILGEKS